MLFFFLHFISLKGQQSVGLTSRYTQMSTSANNLAVSEKDNRDENELQCLLGNIWNFIVEALRANAQIHSCYRQDEGSKVSCQQLIFLSEKMENNGP